MKLRQSKPGSIPREFEEKCDLLLHATGILNNFKWPDIEGLNAFKGKVVRKSFRSLRDFGRSLTAQIPHAGPKTTRKTNGRTNL